MLSRDHLPDPRHRPARCRWWPPTTPRARVATRRCRCCSSGGVGLENRADQRPAHPQAAQRRAGQHRAHRRQRARRCVTPPTISGGSSSPTRSCTACRRTSPSSSPGTATSTPPWATRPSTPRRSSTATGPSSPAAAALRPGRGIPYPHRRGMGGVPRPLRAPQGRHSATCGRAFATPCIHEHSCFSELTV